MFKFHSYYSREKFILSAFFIITLAFTSCKTIKNTEAVNDANAYKTAKELQRTFTNTVNANFETTPVKADSPDGDSADDPAVWLNAANPEKSLIFGSNKQFGIHSYDLKGSEKQFVEYAKINNIDIRQNVTLNGATYDILAGSNRTDKSIDIFVMDASGTIASKPDFQISTGVVKPYGFCLYNNGKQLFAFVNDKDGVIYQIEITKDKDNVFQAQQVRQLKVSSQPEGMVADDAKKRLYVGEEMAGIHVFEAEPQAANRSFMMGGSTQNNKNIRYDIEGLALLPPHYLIASSQGNFSYAIFNTQTHQYVTSFIIADSTSDGVEETDGLEVFPHALGVAYPKGIFVAQDGFNFDGTVKQNQNFKIVDLEQIINIQRP
jgi:3-phytase